MDERALTGLLNDLHVRLTSATTVTAEDRALLTRLSADIQSLLAHPGGIAAAKPHSVLDRLGDAIGRFEVSHPDLTEVMDRISRVLADMGI